MIGFFRLHPDLSSWLVDTQQHQQYTQEVRGRKTPTLVVVESQPYDGELAQIFQVANFPVV